MKSRTGIIFFGIALAMVVFFCGCEKRRTPEELLNMVKTKYSQVADFHEVSTAEVVNNLDEGKVSTTETEMWYRKPNRILFTSNSGQVSAVAACDSKLFYLFVSSLNKCHTGAAPGSISLFYEKVGGGGLIKPSHVILETYLLDGKLPAKGIKSSEIRKKREKIGTTECHVIDITLPTGEKQTLWIGVHDLFIWKNMITVTKASLIGEAIVPSPSPGQKDPESEVLLVSTETMKVVEADKGIPDEKFAWKPPDGVEIVSEDEERGKAARVDLTGKKAPPFTLEDASGKKVSIASLKGKVLILDFWDSWCKSCIKDMKIMQNIQNKGKAEGIVVLGINEEADRTAREKFRALHGITFTDLYDTAGSVSKNYGVDAVPRVVIVSRDGTVAGDFLGVQDEEVITKVVQKLGVK
ncbi:MAG: TlpA disulfide reductase family protein [Candidatus Eremiobacteraeota bacterium]|nr:TlpA disulfide reductase family protein [Candidatus Eremiobacteraeota bacterium]